MTGDWSEQAAALDAELPSLLLDYEASSALDQARDDANDSTVRTLKASLDYMLVRLGERRKGEGVFAPLIEWQDGRCYPPRLEDVEPEVRQFWRAGADKATNPLLAARLADLSWTLRQPDHPDLAARAAVGNYLVLARQDASARETLEQVHHAQRAREIAIELRDEALASQVAAVLLDLAERGSAETEPHPGTVLGALGAVLDVLPDDLTARRDRLLAASPRLFEGHPHNFESAIQMLAQVLPVQQRPPWHRAIVRRWLDAADATEDRLRRFMLRQHALEQALLYELAEEADAVRVLLQAHDHDELGMDVVRAQTEVNGVLEFREWYLGASYVETLASIGKAPAPSGSHEDNARAVQEQRRSWPLQSTFPVRVLGGANSTVWTAERGTPQRDRKDLAQQEHLGITFYAALFERLLAEARDQFGPPARDELVTWLTTDLIDPVLAERLAHGVLLAVQGDHDAAANVLLPRIEAVVRNLVRRTGQSVTIEPRGDRPGGVRSLGALLERLRPALDEDIQRYLVNALVDPLGLNLRNRALHGLWDEAGPRETTVLLHVVSVLANLRAEESSE